MGKLIRELLKALLNATLLLLAVCLVFGWMLMGRVQDVTTRVSSAVAEITPVRDRVEALRAEIAGLRSDLKEGSLPPAPQLDGIELKLNRIEAELAQLRALPATLVQQAAESAAAELTGQIVRLTRCEAAPLDTVPEEDASGG
jgi:hypothetical protein